MDKPTPAETRYQEDHLHDSQAYLVLVVCTTFFALAAVAIFLRVLSRRLVVAGLGKVDYMIFAALVRSYFLHTASVGSSWSLVLKEVD